MVSITWRVPLVGVQSPFSRTALGYVVTSLIFGTGSVIITTIVTQGLNTSTTSTSGIDEVQLFAKIYDAMLSQNSANFNYWMIATYLLFVFAGFTSMVSWWE